MKSKLMSFTGAELLILFAASYFISLAWLVIIILFGKFLKWLDHKVRTNLVLNRFCLFSFYVFLLSLIGFVAHLNVR